MPTPVVSSTRELHIGGRIADAGDRAGTITLTEALVRELRSVAHGFHQRLQRKRVGSPSTCDRRREIPSPQPLLDN